MPAVLEKPKQRRLRSRPRSAPCRVAKSVTADEFFKMSFPHQRAELVNGKVIEMAPAGGEHGVEAFSIALEIGVYVKKKKLGLVCAAETGFRLDDGNVRAPDAAYISNAKLEENRDKMDGKLRTEKFWPFAPDLAVEVVSPGDRACDVAAKVRDWLAAGTQMVWVVYPSEKNIHVYAAPDNWRVLQENERLEGGDVLPGFSCKVKEIFE